MFCVSDRPFPDSFGDAHYEILHPMRFAVALRRLLQEEDPLIYRTLLGEVAYGGYKDAVVETIGDLEGELGNFDASKPELSDYFLKPVKFSSEHEYRYVFQTANENARPFIDLTDRSKELRTCCWFP